MSRSCPLSPVIRDACIEASGKVVLRTKQPAPVKKRKCRIVPLDSVDRIANTRDEATGDKRRKRAARMTAPGYADVPLLERVPLLPDAK